MRGGFSSILQTGLRRCAGSETQRTAGVRGWGILRAILYHTAPAVREMRLGCVFSPSFILFEKHMDTRILLRTHEMMPTPKSGTGKAGLMRTAR